MSEFEEWRDVVGYEGIYQVSSLGRIKRIASGRGARVGRILRPRIRGRVYSAVTLYYNSQAKDHRIHRLVCEAFHGPSPPDHEVNHKNGVKTDNRASNLEWVTSSENKLHSARVLGNQLGELNANSKLTAKQVRRIRRLRTQGCTYAELGQRFGVNPITIHKIAKRKTWTHI